MNRNEALADEHDAERDREWSAYGRADLIDHLREELGSTARSFIQWLEEQDSILYELGHGLQESYGPGGFEWGGVTMDELMDAVFQARLRCAMRAAVSDSVHKFPNDARGANSFVVGYLRHVAQWPHARRV